MKQQASSIQFKSQYFKNRNIGISLRKDSVDKSGEILGIYIFQTFPLKKVCDRKSRCQIVVKLISTC